MDLFKNRAEDILRDRAPLAERMRPRTLDDFIGQEHIVGPGRLLRRAIQADQLSSVIFYGPPGTGKTTLARIIANTTKAQFISINAVLAGVKDIRDAVDSARKTLELYARRTILFVDEVHRFNKAQQDALLPHVENGLLVLIGATTENPYFEVNKALVSRSRIFQLRRLTADDLRRTALQALEEKERGYGSLNVRIDDDALEHLVNIANGDARGVLNALELAVETTPADDSGITRITKSIAEESIQQRAVLYDKDGDAHYDTVSAFIKSLRGSDPDAALYWMARMVYAGEDPRFIFRRMAIFAGEDIGMADPHAMTLVMSAMQAFDFIGMPEGRYHLAHACIYCATAPKSNSSMAFFDALDAVGKEMERDVPQHLMDASRDAEGFGHGQGYLYPHAYRDHWVAQQYLPDALQGRLFYQPSEQGFEQTIRQRVLRIREAQVEAMMEESESEREIALPGATSRPVAAQWSERADSRQGELLGHVRDKLLDMAGVGADSIVLDLCARTGLLALEAARRVKHGAVWALACDNRISETLSAMTSQLDPLARPQIVRVSPDSFERELREAAGEKVLFSSIIGRNVSGLALHPHQYAQTVVSFLDKNGVIALAETLPSSSTRLSELPELSSLSVSLRNALIKVEGLLYDTAEALTVKSLEHVLRSAGASVEITTIEQRSVRRFSGREITQWFRVADYGQRPSLGDRIRETTDAATADQLLECFKTTLSGRELGWRSVVALCRCTRADLADTVTRKPSVRV